jgi:uncharacterized protein YkwD
MHPRKRAAYAAWLVAFVLVLPGRQSWAVGEPVNGFPNWAERVIHEWINRARVDPQFEMNACGSPCVERSCYGVMPPLTWSAALNRSARFHSDEMVRQGYFAHTSACTVVSNIDSLYPTSCNGSAACACVGGAKTCSPTCTGFAQRVQLFGGSPSGEIIASPSDPDYAFYLWLFEPSDTTNCQFTSANGHRWLILESTGAVGAGVAGYSTGDFGGGSGAAKIPSAAHYPQQAASVGVWANWYDSAGPSLATVNVDGACTPMTLQRGTQVNGAWSATVTGVGTGCHRYYINFVDAAGLAVTYPSTGSLAIGSGSTCPDWDSSRPPVCGATAAPSPSASPSRTPLPPTPTASRTPTVAPSPTATSTASATQTSTATPSPTATASATPSATVTAASHDVSGDIQYYSNASAVPQAMVHASGPTVAGAAPTDSSGHYGLTGLQAEDVTIYPEKTGDAGSAVSALDAAFALQAVLGLRQLSPAQRIACDVTGNGSLSALDASLILQHLVGLIARFPVAMACDSDWVFFPNAPASTPGPLSIPPQPGATSCTPGALAYQPLTVSYETQNFLALLFGDCTGNWQPPAAASARRVVERAAGVRAGGLRRLPGGRLALPIFIDPPQPVSALELRILYDPAALRVLRVRTLGGARGALMATNVQQAGVAHIAMAGAVAIDGRRGPVLAAIFAPRGHRVTAPAPSVSGRVEEN